jgi:hypothetical protein
MPGAYHATIRDPKPFTYYQEHEPDEAQYGAFWINSLGEVNVSTALGWISVSPPSLISPNGTRFRLIVDNDGNLGTAQA